MPTYADVCRRFTAADAEERCLFSHAELVPRWCSLALLVQKYLLTGTKVQILTHEEQRERARERVQRITTLIAIALVYFLPERDTPPIAPTPFSLARAHAHSPYLSRCLSRSRSRSLSRSRTHALSPYIYIYITHSLTHSLTLTHYLSLSLSLSLSLRPLLALSPVIFIVRSASFHQGERCVCVCVCQRERERERERDSARASTCACRCA